MNSKIFFLGAIMLLPTFASCQQEKPFPDDAVDKVYEYLPEWQAGYLDIHQISTGRGNAAYLIFPDGTTMLLDAGDLGVHSGTQEIMKAVPNDSKRPAEWIAQYIKHFSLPLKNNGALDYALLTHFDTDHIGQNGKLAIEKVGLDYKLTGITHVGNLLNISTLIDRGYPTYDYPTAAKVSGAHISNYKLYVAARDREGKKNEVHSGTQEIMKAVPNDSKRPAEWIAQYIKHFSLPLKNNGALDYALLTHFDTDHIGQNGKLAIEKVGLDYKLTGITHVGNLLNISTLIDRGYPTYDYPTAAKVSGAHISNYKLYVAARDREGKKNEGFVIGSNSQIKLLKDPGSYPTFEVRNIVGNGKIWTGSGTTAKELVPSTASSSEQLNENRCSCGIRITYGNFDYFSAGDILGVEKAPEWFDIETPVARLLGETDVVVANHHAYSDAMCDTYISQVKPQVYVIPVWDYYHPQPATLSRMLSQTLYPGERSVFAAGMVDSNRSRLGEDGLKIKPAGHVVTRVYPGGEKFQIFVLNDRNEAYEILYKTGEIKSNN